MSGVVNNNIGLAPISTCVESQQQIFARVRPLSRLFRIGSRITGSGMGLSKRLCLGPEAAVGHGYLGGLGRRLRNVNDDAWPTSSDGGYMSTG